MLLRPSCPDEIEIGFLPLQSCIWHTFSEKAGAEQMELKALYISPQLDAFQPLRDGAAP